MKKITAAVLAAVTVFSMAAPVFANDEADSIAYNEEEGYYYVVEETTEPSVTEANDALLASSADSADSIFSFTSPDHITAVSDTPDNAFADEDSIADREVAEIWLCATAASLTGHVWLYIKNITSDCILRVGYITLDPGEAVTVGSLCNLREQGGGTYYNGEAYMAKSQPSYSGSTITLRETLTGSELRKVTNNIKNHNSYNIFLNNCGNFATRIWNEISDKKIVHICFPIITMLEMLAHGGHFGTLIMKLPEKIDDCYKQISGGVETATTGSLEYSCI